MILEVQRPDYKQQCVEQDAERWEEERRRVDIISCQQLRIELFVSNKQILVFFS